jgi:hypothetical protein
MDVRDDVIRLERTMTPTEVGPGTPSTPSQELGSDQALLVAGIPTSRAVPRAPYLPHAAGTAASITISL